MRGAGRGPGAPLCGRRALCSPVSEDEGERRPRRRGTAVGDAGSCGQGDRCSSPAPSFGLCIFWQLLSLWVSASSAFLFNCGWPRPLSVCCGSLSQAMHVISPSSFMWPGCPPTDADLLMRPDVFVRHFWGALLSGFSGPQLSASRVWGQLSPHPGICWWPLSRSLRRWRPAGSCRFLQTGPGPSSHLLGRPRREPALPLRCSPMLAVEAWSPARSEPHLQPETPLVFSVFLCPS